MKREPDSQEVIDGASELPRGIRLSDAEIERIAKIAAKETLVRIYAEVGQSVLRKAAWLIGVVLIALLIYLAGKNALPIPHE